MSLHHIHNYKVPVIYCMTKSMTKQWDFRWPGFSRIFRIFGFNSDGLEVGWQHHEMLPCCLVAINSFPVWRYVCDFRHRIWGSTMPSGRRTNLCRRRLFRRDSVHCEWHPSTARRVDWPERCPVVPTCRHRGWVTANTACPWGWWGGVCVYCIEFCRTMWCHSKNYRARTWVH